MKSIYIVVGECGDYDGIRSWNVSAFSKEEDARNFSDMCQAIANSIWNVRKYSRKNDRERYDDYMKKNFHHTDGEGLHKLDKNYQNDIATDTKYEVVEVEFVK